MEKKCFLLLSLLLMGEWDGTKEAGEKILDTGNILHFVPDALEVFTKQLGTLYAGLNEVVNNCLVAKKIPMFIITIEQGNGHIIEKRFFNYSELLKYSNDDENKNNFNMDTDFETLQEYLYSNVEQIILITKVY